MTRKLGNYFLYCFSASALDRVANGRLQLLTLTGMNSDVVLIGLQNPTMMSPLFGRHLLNPCFALLPAVHQELVLVHQVLVNAQINEVYILLLIPANEVSRLGDAYFIGRFHFFEENGAPIKPRSIDRCQAKRTIRVVFQAIQARRFKSATPREGAANRSSGVRTARSVGTAFRSRVSTFRASLDRFFCAVPFFDSDGVDYA